MNMDELHTYFLEHDFATYERNNFDSFLEEVKFAFPIKCVHITGTNGKGSVANFLYHIYLSSGYHVGFFNSPFLDRVNEMISVDGEEITDEQFLAIFDKYQSIFEKYNLSSFEMQTFIAYHYFMIKGVDLAVIEVGMGGFIDATNIITPILSIITSVSLEHTNFLGRSISEIAASKAGIIKWEVPCLIGKLDETAEYAIRERAKSEKAPLFIVDDYHNEKLIGKAITFDYYPYHNLKINTSAFYQLKNASLAIETTKIISEVMPINEEALLKGLQCPMLKTRFEYLNDHLIVDGAHNPEGIENLVDTLIASESRPIHVVFAAFRDKNIDPMLICLQKDVADILITTFDHKRARTEEEYFLYLGDYPFEADWKKAIFSLIERYPDDVVLVTGSLHFAGMVRHYYKEIK